jgi:hypothetical protein
MIIPKVITHYNNEGLYYFHLTVNKEENFAFLFEAVKKLGEKRAYSILKESSPQKLTEWLALIGISVEKIAKAPEKFFLLANALFTLNTFFDYFTTRKMLTASTDASADKIRKGLAELLFERAASLCNAYQEAIKEVATGQIDVVMSLAAILNKEIALITDKRGFINDFKFIVFIPQGKQKEENKGKIFGRMFSLTLSYPFSLDDENGLNILISLEGGAMIVANSL